MQDPLILLFEELKNRTICQEPIAYIEMTTTFIEYFCKVQVAILLKKLVLIKTKLVPKFLDII